MGGLRRAGNAGRKHASSPVDVSNRFFRSDEMHRHGWPGTQYGAVGRPDRQVIFPGSNMKGFACAARDSRIQMSRFSGFPPQGRRRCAVRRATWRASGTSPGRQRCPAPDLRGHPDEARDRPPPCRFRRPARLCPKLRNSSTGCLPVPHVPLSGTDPPTWRAFGSNGTAITVPSRLKSR